MTTAFRNKLSVWLSKIKENPFIISTICVVVFFCFPWFYSNKTRIEQHRIEGYIKSVQICPSEGEKLAFLIEFKDNVIISLKKTTNEPYIFSSQRKTSIDYDRYGFIKEVRVID